MPDAPVKLVVDVSRTGLHPQETLDKMRQEALSLLEGGDTAAAQNVLAQITDIEKREEGPDAVQYIELSDEEIKEREKFAKENEKLTIESNRSERNARLQLSDWTQLPDAPLSEAQQKKWVKYRQDLRDLDLTKTPTPKWPTPPS